jgi:hypothetical protein
MESLIRWVEEIIFLNGAPRRIFSGDAGLDRFPPRASRLEGICTSFAWLIHRSHINRVTEWRTAAGQDICNNINCLKKPKPDTISRGTTPQAQKARKFSTLEITGDGSSILIGQYQRANAHNPE